MAAEPALVVQGFTDEAVLYAVDCHVKKRRHPKIRAAAQRTLDWYWAEGYKLRPEEREAKAREHVSGFIGLTLIQWLMLGKFIAQAIIAIIQFLNAGSSQGYRDYNAAREGMPIDGEAQVS